MMPRLKLLLVPAFIFMSGMLLLGQNQVSGSERLKTGSMVKETITYTDAGNNPNYSQVPALYHILFYRFRDTLGNLDNVDSIIALEKIISDIENALIKTPNYKSLHVECHMHINDHVEVKKIQRKADSIRAEAYKTNKFSHGWSFIHLDEKKLKQSSVLNAGKLCLVSPKGRIMATGYISGLDGNKVSSNTIMGKLLTESNGKKTPLVKTHVSLIKSDQSKIAETYTNNDGEFELDLPDNSSYTLSAKPASKDVKMVILATQNGVELSRFRKTKDGFHYPLLKADISKLKEVPVNDDLTLTFNKFKSANAKNLNITENITYGVGQFSVESQSEPILNKVFAVLVENPAVILEVISHTDAQGDDAANLALSEKRARAVMDYLVAKGIDKNRLKSTGKGETKIRNRCTNGVECSDKEHEYNRRTEFNFSKK